MKTKTLQMKRALRAALLVLLLIVVGMGEGIAQDQFFDFSAVCATGQTLYYTIIDADNHYVAIACPNVNGWLGSGYPEPTGNIVLPESVQHGGVTYTVTTIGYKAFYCCHGLTGSLTIPNSVTTIGQSAFDGCYGFTGSLTIGNSVTSIGESAFGDCPGFTELTIGRTVTTIGARAFYGCYGLTGDLILPSSVVDIGMAAFFRCSNVGHIIVEEGNAIYDSRGNCNAIIETATNKLLLGCKNTFVPSTVSLFGYGAFANCDELTTFSVSNNITTIEPALFAYCNNLEQIVVEQGNLVYDSRNGCNAIIETNSNTLIAGCMNTIIPNSVTSLGICAFMGNSSMETIYIPNSIVSIGGGAFYECIGLSFIVVPESVESLGYGAFYLCFFIDTAVVLGATPPTIEEGFGLFCTGSNNVTLIVGCGYKEDYENSAWANNVATIEEDCGQHSVMLNENGMTGGNVSASVTSTELGEEVQLTIMPDEGMKLASIVVSNANDSEQTIPVYPIGRESSTYGFIMPPFDVVVSATFSPASVINEDNETLASVYPNPTNGQVTIEAEGLKQITISNLQGQTVYEGHASGNEFTYDFGNHEAGVYVVRIGTANGAATKRVVVAR